MERLPRLAKTAWLTLETLGIRNVRVMPAGEVLGCPEEAPFDVIIVTAAAPRLPPELLEQLTIGGRMIIPIGSRYEQDLMKVVRTSESHSLHSLGSCRFVPLLGKGAWDHA